MRTVHLLLFFFMIIIQCPPMFIRFNESLLISLGLVQLQRNRIRNVHRPVLSKLSLYYLFIRQRERERIEFLQISPEDIYLQQSEERSYTTLSKSAFDS